MNSKNIIALLIIIVVIGGGFFLLSRTSEAPTDAVPSDASQTESPATDETNDTNTQPDGASSGENQPESGVPAANTATVTYTDGGFSPASVTVKKGDMVRFVNKFGGDMWVASAKHPTHAAYDGTSLSAHCFGSGAVASFDQCGAGDEYSFTFEKAGTWTYHDHVHPSNIGKVVVE